MDEFTDYVTPYSEQDWRNRQAEQEAKARRWGLVGDGLLFVKDLRVMVLGAVAKANSEAAAASAREMARRAEEARNREQAAKEKAEQEAQAEREAWAERERAAEQARQREEDRQARQNLRDWGVEKPRLELGRDLPEPSLRDHSNDV